MEVASHELRIVEVAGTPERMGLAHGEACRAEIRELVEIRLARLAAFARRHNPPRSPSREQTLAAAAGTIHAHQQYDPASWQELEGIARGAGVGTAELLLVNGYTDFRDLLAFGEPGPAEVDECSAFLVSAARGAGGSPLIGQTWDLHANGLPFAILLRRRPDAAPATLAVTATGCLCVVGMNDRGLAIGTTNVVPVDPQAGVNYVFAITAALQCGSAEEAAKVIEATPRLSGHNFLLADARQAMNLETTAARSERTDVTGEAVFVHTNHYLCPSLQPLEVKRDLSDSLWRRDRLAANFAALTGPLSMDDCWAQLADRTRGAGIICNEDYEERYGTVATLATIVQCPGEGRMYVCRGGARPGQHMELGV